MDRRISDLVPSMFSHTTREKVARSAVMSCHGHSFVIF